MSVWDGYFEGPLIRAPDVSGEDGDDVYMPEVGVGSGVSPDQARDGWESTMEGIDSATSYTIDTIDSASESLLKTVLEVVPWWGWGLGAIVLAGALFTYTRPLWTIAAGVVPS